MLISFLVFWLSVTIYTWLFCGWQTGCELARVVLAIQKSGNSQPPPAVMYVNIFYQGIAWPAFWMAQLAERYTFNQDASR